MLNFDGDVDANANVKCEHSINDILSRNISLGSDFSNTEEPLLYLWKVATSKILNIMGIDLMCHNFSRLKREVPLH